METKPETSESAKVVINKVDLNRFPIPRWSRWTDEKARLLVVAGFYHGKDHANPFSDSFARIGLDILNVHNETVEYMEISRFVHFVIHKKLMPWKDQETKTEN